MNILHGTGQLVTVALGEDYTVLDDEVFINNHLYRKKDLEIQISNNYAQQSDQKKVKVGIRLRDSNNSLPADMKNYEKWTINGVVQTSLSQLVNNINTLLQT